MVSGELKFINLLKFTLNLLKFSDGPLQISCMAIKIKSYILETETSWHNNYFFGPDNTVKPSINCKETLRYKGLR